MGIFARTKSIVVVSLIAAALSLGAMAFLVERIFSVNQATSELSQKITTESERDSQLRSLQSLLEGLSTEETSLDSRFVGSDGVVPFIELLEDLAADAGGGVEVASVAIQPDAEASYPYEWLRMALKFTGSWQELFHFVVLLETAPYAIKLDQVALTYSDTEGAVGWEGTFLIRTAKLKGAQP